jgi:hypothetical protein
MSAHAKLRTLGLALALAASPLAGAEDIDIFSGRGNLALPNLIIILDNTGNWGSSFPRPSQPLNCGNSSSQSTRYCAAKTALYNAINSINTSAGAKINVGLMLFNYNNGKANTPSRRRRSRPATRTARSSGSPCSRSRRRRNRRCSASSAASTNPATKAWATRRTRCRWRRRAATSAALPC